MADDAVVTGNSDEIVEDEGMAANGNTQPGHLVARDSSNDIVPHGTDGGTAGQEWADLPFDPEKDKTDSYAADEVVRTFHAQPGVHIDALLATGEDVDPSTFLVSAGDGTLRAATPGSDEPGAVVARADESLNNTSGTPSRLEVVTV